MAATRPDKTLEWATRAGASVIEPPSAKRQDGWVGGEEPPASWFNWWMKLAWEWVSYLDVHDDEREAERRDFDVVANARLMTAAAYFTGITPKEPTDSGVVVGAVDYQTPRYVVFWTDGSYAYSSDGHVWTAGAVVHANCDWLATFSNDSEFIVVGPAGTIYTAYASAPTTWTKRTPAEAAELHRVLWHAPANRLIVTTGNHHVQTSDNFGVTWTKRAFPGTDVIVTNGIAANPAGAIVAVGIGLDGNSGLSVRSLDGGLTWEVGSLIAGSQTLIDVVWSERRQAWFATGSYDVYTSTDGLAWTSVASVYSNRIFELERVIAAYPSGFANPVRGLYAHLIRDTDSVRVPTSGGAASIFVASLVRYAGQSAIVTWYRAATGSTEWVTVSDWFGPLQEPPP